MSGVTALPDGLPVLSGGMHADPSDGGCFMEYASLLAGQRWSDHPSCTHPALAQLARLINDLIADADRQSLAPMIPDVVGVNGKDARVSARLALLCLDHAPTDDGAHPGWARHAARRITWASHGGALTRWWCRRTDAVYRVGPVARIMLFAVRGIAAERDGAARLRRLLHDAIAQTAGLCLERAPSAARPAERFVAPS